MRRSKKTSKFRVTGLSAGNSSVTGEFSTQMASNAKNVSISWHHPVTLDIPDTLCQDDRTYNKKPDSDNVHNWWVKLSKLNRDLVYGDFSDL